MGDDGKVDINMNKPAPDDDDLWYYSMFLNILI